MKHTSTYLALSTNSLRFWQDEIRARFDVQCVQGKKVTRNYFFFLFRLCSIFLLQCYESNANMRRDEFKLAQSNIKIFIDVLLTSSNILSTIKNGVF
jgi:hypothetical protein